MYSNSYDKIYIGYSSNLEERLKSHKELGTKGWTIKFRPWELLYSETFDDKKSAMKREKALKTYRGREYIRTVLLKSSVD